MTQSPRRRVVVGVDPSEGSRLALRWAADYAERFDADLVVVHAFRAPHAPVAGYLTPGVSPDRSEQLGLEALDEIIDEVFGLEAEGLPLHRVAESGPAARVLLQMAEGADLLVVGGQRHAGMAGALLGSVADRCAREAPCPVVVVRAIRPVVPHQTRVIRVTSEGPVEAGEISDPVGVGPLVDAGERSGPS